MNNKKQIALILWMFSIGISSVFGQISNVPTNHNVSLDKTLYEHGYNKDNLTTPDSPREDIDTVMVTSTMNYFVMPDTYYNKVYFQGTNYAATNLTGSKFDWTVTNGTAVAQNPNTATTPGTSPWVKITWNATGAAEIKMKEIPQNLPAACEGAETTIPVYVIAKPTIGFNQTGTPLAYSASECYTDATIGGASYNFSFNVTTGSSQVLVNYSVKKTDLWTGVVTTLPGAMDVPVTLTPGAPGVYTGAMQIYFSAYGEYEVTITKITDRIARKCEVDGSINAGQNVFTYSALPQPKAGEVYHVPNNF